MEVLIPPLTQTGDSVKLVTWYKREGEVVTEGEPLFSIETDKAVLDVEAQASGILRSVKVFDGEDAKTLSVAAHIEPAVETIGQPGGAFPAGAASGAKVVACPPPVISPRPEVAPGVPVATIIAEAAPALGPAPGEAAAMRPLSPDLPVSGEPSDAGDRVPAAGASTQRQRQGSTRAIIAQRMWQSASTTARMTLTAEADATELVALRKKLASEGRPAGYNDFFILILAQLLQEEPALNASLDGDVVRLWEHVHISIAVDTPRGLLAPVLRDVQGRSLAQIADGTRELAEKARTNKLPPDDLRGGTFTLTNLGAYGIDAFTPIINLPEAAILGVGRIKARPVVQGEQVVVRDTVWLSLTFDNRVVGAGAAGRFLQRLVELVGNPLEIHKL